MKYVYTLRYFPKQIKSEKAISKGKIKGLLEIHSEKAVAPHSSTLAWKIPWMEEPGRLQSMGLLESDVTE